MNADGHMIVIGYADRGTGFAREPDNNDIDTREYWRAASDLIDGDVGQPPGALRQTGDEPVWSLRSVDIGGEAWWCFSMQARGGVWGPAGACRFGFMHGTELPAHVWRVGAETVAGAPARSTKSEPEAVASVFRSLAAGRTAVAIDAAPHDAAGVIEDVLHRLPPMAARRYVWSTCLIQMPSTRRAGVVSGRLPAAFAERLPTLSRQLDTLLAVERPGEALSESAIAWWLANEDAEEQVHAAIGREIVDVADLVQTVQQHILPVNSVADVARLLGKPGAERRLIDSPYLVEWVRKNPNAALNHVQAAPPAGPAAELARKMFAVLAEVQADRSAQEPVNYLGLPTADRPMRGDQVDRLGPLLHDFIAASGHDAGSVMSILLDGWPDNDLIACRDLLAWLRVAPKDFPKLFPTSRERLLRTIVGGSVADAKAELGLSRQPYHDLAWLIQEPELLSVSPELPARLYEPYLGLATQHSGALESVLVRRMAPLKGRQKDWAEGFLVCLDRSPRRVVLRAQPDTKGWIVNRLVPFQEPPPAPPPPPKKAAKAKASAPSGTGNWPDQAGAPAERPRSLPVWLPIVGILIFAVLVGWLLIMLGPTMNENPSPPQPTGNPFVLDAKYSDTWFSQFAGVAGDPAAWQRVDIEVMGQKETDADQTFIIQLGQTGYAVGKLKFIGRSDGHPAGSLRITLVPARSASPSEPPVPSGTVSDSPPDGGRPPPGQ